MSDRAIRRYNDDLERMYTDWEFYQSIIDEIRRKERSRFYIPPSRIRSEPPYYDYR